ncbi:hypothetical protein [Elioraea rosea]|uniref:hypothetical protein n=1 Tax=Elioraea rosea TaxID=2492390 RepID=UPI00118627F0|nr:hypothetical protein [Elioraea rosea]
MPRRLQNCLFLGLALLGTLALAAPSRAERAPCPNAGTVAVRDDGQRFVFMGEDPEEDGLCVVRVGENTRRLLFGFWAPLGPDIFEARTALWRLLLGEPGTVVTIREHVVTDSWVETWERGAEEEVALANGSRRAIRLERQMRLHGPTGFRASVSYWIDADTGVVLRATHKHVDGMKLPYRDIAITHLDTRG